MRLIDCNGFIGRRNTQMQGSFYSQEDYVKYMDLYNIEQAFVCHSVALEYDCADGNMLLMEEIKDSKRLLPVWLVMPNYTKEFLDASPLAYKLKENNVRLVRIAPSFQRFSLGTYCCGELLAMLEAENIPLLIEMSETTADSLNVLCSEYPNLNVIVTNISYGNGRFMYPVLKNHKNLFLEVSGVRGNMAIEDFCSTFSAKRLLFGTNMPMLSGASAVALLSYADISPADKERIANKNLEELLNVKG